MKSDYTIGVLGGMGTYATIHLFQQYAEIFEAEKEWDRPRIIIDNRCTMPSRVRAFLYQESVEQLVNELCDSIQNLKKGGVSRIVLDCNTSHLFLPQVYERYPDARNYIVNIIDICVNKISEDGLTEIYLLATEGTISSNLYQNALAEKGIKCYTPTTGEFALLRQCIEAVKQNKYDEVTKDVFSEFVGRYDACILGCTEFPVLYEKCFGKRSKKVYDPIRLTLEHLHEEFVS